MLGFFPLASAPLADDGAIVVYELGRKIRSTQFNLDQLTVGKDAFVNMLTASLATETETEVEPEPEPVGEFIEPLREPEVAEEPAEEEPTDV